MTVKIEGERVTVDLSDTDLQRPSPTNATFSQTYSAIVYVLKCLVDEDIPVNDGFYRLGWAKAWATARQWTSKMAQEKSPRVLMLVE